MAMEITFFYDFLHFEKANEQSLKCIFFFKLIFLESGKFSLEGPAAGHLVQTATQSRANIKVRSSCSALCSALSKDCQGQGFPSL